MSEKSAILHEQNGTYAQNQVCHEPVNIFFGRIQQFFKPLILNDLFFAREMGNLLKAACLLALAAVKSGFSTKLSTEFVEILKMPYKTGT